MSCTKRLLRTMLASKALLVRIIYAIHASVGVLIAVLFTDNYYIALFQVFALVLLVEYIWTLRKQEKGEWKWLLPSVVIYILWLTPPIFILEWVAKNERMEILKDLNASIQACPTSLADISELLSTDFTNVSALTGEDLESKEYHDIVRQYSVLLQQTMMLVFICGRWLGPKGSMTREQLSQLLLAYVGMAADMLEFIMETLKVPEVACSDLMFPLVVTIWCWSILQYTLGLTATKQRKTRVVGTAESQQDPCSVVHGCRSFLHCCCGGEIWALLVSVIMQDGPYLALRLYLLIALQEFGQIFFTVKNGILFCLQLYRISVVIGVITKGKNKDRSGRGNDPPYEFTAAPVEVKRKTSSVASVASSENTFHHASAI